MSEFTSWIKNGWYMTEWGRTKHYFTLDRSSGALVSMCGLRRYASALVVNAERKYCQRCQNWIEVPEPDGRFADD